MTPSSGRASPGEARAASVISHATSVPRRSPVNEPMLGVTEITTRAGLHQNTVSRLLAAVEQEDAVGRDSQTRRYRLAPSSAGSRGASVGSGKTQ